MLKTIEKQPSDELIKKVGYLKNEDIKQIKDAVDFVIRKHEGQLRKSGEPYYIHPIEAAKTLAELKLDKVSIIAALLHDVVEDTDTTLDEIEIGKYNFQSKEEAEAENFRKMIVSMAEDIRVILVKLADIVKLADRLHNIRTLEPLPEEKRRRIAKETLDIYAPLAARLGLWSI